MDWKDFTDIHIHMKDVAEKLVDVDGSLLFPGARNAGAEHAQSLGELARLCYGKARPQFTVTMDGVFFRVRRDDYAVDGTWFRLRRMADEPPELNTLKFRMHQGVEALLLDQTLERGGLVLITGPTGAGKTNSAAATVVSRLKAYGGVAYTVEDPVELPLNGRHGQGYCTQCEVAGGADADWVESLRGVLRSQPVGTSVILYVGEIQDAESAKIMLRAATNGFLVICTSFGSDIITSLQGLLNLLGAENSATLAQVLRVCLHQELLPDRLAVTALASHGSNSRVASLIRSGSLNQLQDEIHSQRNAMNAALARPAVTGLRQAA